MSKTPIVYDMGSHTPLPNGETLPGDVIQISNDADNSISIGSDGGLLGAASGITSVAVQDTQTVDMAGAGTQASPVTSNVKVSAMAGNTILTQADGLYVAQSMTSVAVGDTDSIAMSGTGSGSTPIVGNVRVSTQAGQLLSSSTAGLYVGLNTADTGTVTLTGAGTTGSNLSASVKISADAGNGLYLGTDGGLAAPSGGGGGVSGTGNVVVISDTATDFDNISPSIDPFVLPAESIGTAFEFRLADLGLTASDMALYSALYMKMGVVITPSPTTPFTMVNNFDDQPFPTGTNGRLSVSLNRAQRNATSNPTYGGNYYSKALLPIGDGTVSLSPQNHPIGATLFSDRVINPEAYTSSVYFAVYLAVYPDTPRTAFARVSVPITVQYNYTLFGVLK